MVAGWLLAVAMPGGPIHAAQPSAPTIAVTHDPLTPYHSGGCWNPDRYPCYRVHGTADPGALVEVTITDDPPTGHSVRLSVFAAEADDPGTGQVAGDWSASPNVTVLGGHGPEPSTLVFSAEAVDEDGNRSSASSVTATKTTVTPGDETGPLARAARDPNGFPPSIWARYCISPCGPVTVACLVTPRRLPPEEPTDFLPGGCPGTASVQGRVEDDHPDALGVASEIADVVIQVVRSSDQVLVDEFHAFTRRGTQAFYGVALHIDDYEPLTTYDVFVQGFDAAGNPGNVIASTFFVMPI